MLVERTIRVFAATPPRRHRARCWDRTQGPGICSHSSVGPGSTRPLRIIAWPSPGRIPSARFTDDRASAGERPMVAIAPSTQRNSASGPACDVGTGLPAALLRGWIGQAPPDIGTALCASWIGRFYRRLGGERAGCAADQSLKSRLPRRGRALGARQPHTRAWAQVRVQTGAVPSRRMLGWVGPLRCRQLGPHRRGHEPVSQRNIDSREERRCDAAARGVGLPPRGPTSAAQLDRPAHRNGVSLRQRRCATKPGPPGTAILHGLRPLPARETVVYGSLVRRVRPVGKPTRRGLSVQDAEPACIPALGACRGTGRRALGRQDGEHPGLDCIPSAPAIACHRLASVARTLVLRLRRAERPGSAYMSTMGSVTGVDRAHNDGPYRRGSVTPCWPIYLPARSA